MCIQPSSLSLPFGDDYDEEKRLRNLCVCVFVKFVFNSHKNFHLSFQTQNFFFVLLLLPFPPKRGSDLFVVCVRVSKNPILFAFAWVNQMKQYIWEYKRERKAIFKYCFCYSILNVFILVFTLFLVKKRAHTHERKFNSNTKIENRW